jgi:hypothetical protein
MLKTLLKRAGNTIAVVSGEFEASRFDATRPRDPCRERDDSADGYNCEDEFHHLEFHFTKPAKACTETFFDLLRSSAMRQPPVR